MVALIRRNGGEMLASDVFWQLGLGKRSGWLMVSRCRHRQLIRSDGRWLYA